MLSLLCAFGAAQAADPPADTAGAQARYEKERARCLSGTSGQDQQTCLKEAGAALDAGKRKQLNDGDAEYRKNALIRCNALPAADQEACKARIAGMGTSSGSVSGGGIYRETVTREVKSPAGSASGVVLQRQGSASAAK